MQNSNEENRKPNAAIPRLLTICMLIAQTIQFTQAQTLNPGVIDPTNTYAGKTYSEWAAAWGQYWMSQSTLHLN